jgi:hypothetical protein
MKKQPNGFEAFGVLNVLWIDLPKEDLHSM